MYSVHILYSVKSAELKTTEISLRHSNITCKRKNSVSHQKLGQTKEIHLIKMQIDIVYWKSETKNNNHHNILPRKNFFLQKIRIFSIKDVLNWYSRGALRLAVLSVLLTDTRMLDKALILVIPFHTRDSHRQISMCWGMMFQSRNSPEDVETLSETWGTYFVNKERERHLQNSLFTLSF